jgi:hypothetical protein
MRASLSVPALILALSREPDVNIPNHSIFNRYNYEDLSRTNF